MQTLPKSTPVSVRHLVAEMSGELSHLRVELARLQQAEQNADADRAIAKADAHVNAGVFDRINRRTNQYGEILNCRISENCGRLNLRIASEALGRTLSSRHSAVRKDRNGRSWVDFYPATTESTDIMSDPQPDPAENPFPSSVADDDFPF